MSTWPRYSMIECSIAGDPTPARHVAVVVQESAHAAPRSIGHAGHDPERDTWTGALVFTRPRADGRLAGFLLELEAPDLGSMHRTIADKLGAPVAR